MRTIAQIDEELRKLISESFTDKRNQLLLDKIHYLTKERTEVFKQMVMNGGKK